MLGGFSIFLPNGLRVFCCKRHTDSPFLACLRIFFVYLSIKNLLSLRHETFDDYHIRSYGERKDESCCCPCIQDRQLGCLLLGVVTTKGAEIISADSRQVYRGMDIGTGKDLEDYTVDGKLIPYH